MFEWRDNLKTKSRAIKEFFLAPDGNFLFLFFFPHQRVFQLTDYVWMGCPNIRHLNRCLVPKTIACFTHISLANRDWAIRMLGQFHSERRHESSFWIRCRSLKNGQIWISNSIFAWKCPSVVCNALVSGVVSMSTLFTEEGGLIYCVVVWGF